MTSSAPESAAAPGESDPRTPVRTDGPAGGVRAGGVPTGSTPGALGLRERKKARTRAAIRSEAIRLFAEQGYGATTVEQIADAADVSPSTFFRYFPTKEAVIITDEFDGVILEDFRNQPADLHPVRAFRNAILGAFRSMSPEAAEQERLRHGLLQTVPELRSAMLDEFAVSLQRIAEVIGERVGRPGTDLRARALAGALIGVSVSVTFASWTEPLPADLGERALLVDAALELLEQGLPL
jgi:AcrR family transcriptional regulator